MFSLKKKKRILSNWPVRGDKRLYTFTESISPKVNIKAQPKFEPKNYNLAVQHVSHYAIVTHTHITVCKQMTILVRVFLSTTFLKNVIEH